MGKITKYKAIDGKEFNSESDCQDYEILIDQVNQIMSQIEDCKKYDEGLGFSNGEGYVQHKPETFLKVKREILELVKTKIDHHWIQQTIDAIGTDDVHPSWVGRILGDYNFDPIYKAWYRISCTDNKYREWGQGYFAANPEKGKQIELNRKESSI